VVAVVIGGVAALVSLKKERQAEPDSNQPPPVPVVRPLPLSPAEPLTFKVGDTVALANTIGHVPLATTADIYRAYRQANESARIDHYRREEVLTVPVPAEAVVLEIVGELLKVRIKDGYHKDKAGFIDQRDVAQRKK
jgi:hypothetical protein